MTGGALSFPSAGLEMLAREAAQHRPPLEDVMARLRFTAAVLWIRWQLYALSLLCDAHAPSTVWGRLVRFFLLAQ